MLPNSTSQGLTAETSSSACCWRKRPIDEALLAQAGIDAKEREAADKLQKLILDELHHRIRTRSRPSAPSHPRACALQRASNTGGRPLTADWSRLGACMTC